jgi:hypothetical protein
MILSVGVLGVGRHVWAFLPLVEDAVHLRGSVPLDFVVVGCLPLDEPATVGRRRTLKGATICKEPGLLRY